MRDPFNNNAVLPSAQYASRRKAEEVYVLCWDPMTEQSDEVQTGMGNIGAVHNTQTNGT